MKSKSLAEQFQSTVKREKEASKNKISLKKFENAEKLLGDFEDDNKLNKKIEKIKVIRDTFSLPETDYKLLNECKTRGLAAQYAINKSEIVRAGLILLSNLSNDEFVNAIKLVKKIKTGRPKP